MVVFESDDEARAWDAYAAAWLAGRTHDAPDRAEAADFADAMLLERRKRFFRHDVHRCIHIVGGPKCRRDLGHFGPCEAP